MPIKGDLSQVDLSNIFQMLTLNQNEGTLNIYYEGVHQSIYFTGNDIIKPFDPDAMEDRVLSLLLRQGKLSEDQVDRARYNTETLQTGLLGALVQMRYVAEEDVHAAYLLNMEEDVYELFLVKDAHFEFLEGEKPSDKKTMDTRFVLPPNNLLMEAVRRGDEWAHIRERIPSGVEVFEVIDPTLPDGVDDENGEYALILNATDGIRSVNRTIEETRLHRFTVFKVCSVLLECGKIAPLDSQELVNRGDACIEASRTWDAIDLYERAIASGVSDPHLYEKIGNAYKSVSENRKACQHFYKLCEHYEARGALKQAIQTYTLIRELLPTEIVARERIFLLYLNSEELFEDIKYNAQEEGTELALIFKELGRFEDALELVNLLFTAYEENNEVLEGLAKLALDVQSSATALKILEYLGERLLDDNCPSKALRVYRRMKCIDPEYRGIDDKLDRLMLDDLERRNRRKRVMKTTALISVFIGLFLGYFLFNSLAFKAYGSLNHAEILESTDFTESKKTYKAFCAKYPLSIYWFLAREKLSAIENAEECFKEADVLRMVYNAEEKRAGQQNAENLLIDAQRYLNNAEFDDALRLLRKVIASATDRAWLENNGVQEKLANLERYFEEAGELKGEAEKLTESGKFEEAHGLLVKLVQKYNHTEAAQGVQLPLLVKSNPSGARIMIDGETVQGSGGQRSAVTPAVLNLAPDSFLEVSLEKEGFMPEKQVIDTYSIHELNFDLRFKAERSFTVGTDLVSQPAKARAGFVLAFKNGRLKFFDQYKEDFTWTYTIKALKNLSSPIGISEERVLFGWGEDRVTALDIDSGEELWEVQLPAACVWEPLEWVGRVFVPHEPGGLFLLDPKKGRIKGEVDLGGRPALAPLKWSRGVILCLDDGRLLWVEGNTGEVVQERRISFSPTAATVDAGRMLIGNANGGIDGFDQESGEALFSFQSKVEYPIDQLASRGDRVFAVVQGKKVLSIDTVRLETTGEFTEGSACLWLGAPGSDASIAVGGSHSFIYLLRSSDLSVIRRYRADGEINHAGLDGDGYVYFYSKTGVVNGVRY